MQYQKGGIMADHDVLLEKINQVQDCLSRIHSKVDDDINRLEDIDIREIVVFNLQRAIQHTIDLAFHIISTEKLGLAQNLKDSFIILQNNKIISREIAEKLIKMVGFRNIVVHEYENINLEILQNIVKYRLKDLEDFYSIILQRYEMNG